MSFIFRVFTLCILSAITEALSPHRAMVLLRQYGYLKAPSQEHINNPDFASSAIVDRNYTEAIKLFQARYKLPVNGILTTEVKKLLTTSRCGNPDFISENDRLSLNGHSLIRVKRYYVDDTRMKWSKKDLTWKINSYPTSGLSDAAVRAIFTEAFNMWGKVTDLNYREETNSNLNADIIIEFKKREHGDSIPFDGPNYVLAHAFYPIASPVPAYSRSGDAHFDDDEMWVDGEILNGRNLLAVAVHELGHSMGLGHSALDSAIMYPFYINPKGSTLKLDDDDVKGMQSIYGAPTPGKYLPPIPHVPSNGHRNTHPIIPTTAPINPPKLDMCNTTIDTVIIIREVEIYVFSGKNQWRIDFSKTVTSWISYELRDGPETILYYWPVLPKFVDRIDGGIERKDQKIYMFKDKHFWMLEDNQRLSHQMPEEGLPLTKLGLPSDLKKIDTIFRWGYNKALYIMAGYKYWKINEDVGQFGHIYPRYPRLISTVWKGVPLPIDVAFTDLHLITYFIKGKVYYEFNNLEMKVQGEAMQLTAPWIGCKKPRYF